MNIRKIFLLTLLALPAAPYFSRAEIPGSKHDFSREVWSDGKTCRVCHTFRCAPRLKLPPDAMLPGPDSRPPLTPDEKDALTQRPMNAICYACHRKNGNPDQPDPNHTGTGTPIPRVGSTGSGAPSVSTGSRASVCIRVNSRSTQSRDCLKCHDVHKTENPHLLRPQENSDLPVPL